MVVRSDALEPALLHVCLVIDGDGLGLGSICAAVLRLEVLLARPTRVVVLPMASVPLGTRR